jgi:hypothetical protein
MLNWKNYWDSKAIKHRLRSKVQVESPLNELFLYINNICWF